MCGDDIITDKMAQKWFRCFKETNFELTDFPRFGRPVQFDEHHALIKEGPRQTTREFAQKITSSHVTPHLHSMGKVQSNQTTQAKLHAEQMNKLKQAIQLKKKP